MGLAVQERTDCITGQVGRVPMLYGAIVRARDARCTCAEHACIGPRVTAAATLGLSLIRGRFEDDSEHGFQAFRARGDRMIGRTS